MKLDDEDAVLEKCKSTSEAVAILQFDAETWNATNYRGKSRSELLRRAHKHIENRADPSIAVEAFWDLVSKEMKK